MQLPLPPEDTEGALLGRRVDGTGVPMIKAAAASLKPRWARARSGSRRRQRRWGAAFPSIRSHGLPKPWRRFWSSRSGARTPVREGVTDDVPRAPQVRWLASLVWTKPVVMALIKADVARKILYTAPP